jgi:hypothetical protein
MPKDKVEEILVDLLEFEEWTNTPNCSCDACKETKAKISQALSAIRKLYEERVLTEEEIFWIAKKGGDMSSWGAKRVAHAISEAQKKKLEGR